MLDSLRLAYLVDSSKEKLPRELGGVSLSFHALPRDSAVPFQHKFVKHITCYQHLKHVLLAFNLEPTCDFPKTCGSAVSLIKRIQKLCTYFNEDSDRLAEIVGGRIEATLVFNSTTPREDVIIAENFAKSLLSVEDVNGLFVEGQFNGELRPLKVYLLDPVCWLASLSECVAATAISISGRRGDMLYKTQSQQMVILFKLLGLRPPSWPEAVVTKCFGQQYQQFPLYYGEGVL